MHSWRKYVPPQVGARRRLQGDRVPGHTIKQFQVAETVDDTKVLLPAVKDAR